MLWVNRNVTKVFSVGESSKFGDLLISIKTNWVISKVRNWLVSTTFSNETIILMSNINDRIFVVIECDSFVICSSTEGRECTSTKLMVSYMLVCNRTCESEQCLRNRLNDSCLRLGDKCEQRTLTNIVLCILLDTRTFEGKESRCCTVDNSRFCSRNKCK